MSQLDINVKTVIFFSFLFQGGGASIITNQENDDYPKGSFIKIICFRELV